MPLELHLRSNDAEALLRIVDPEGEFNDAPENDLRVVADDTIEPAHCAIVGDSPAAGTHELRSLDPVTYAIIALSHNSAGDFEAVKALAAPGVFEGDIGEAATAQYEKFVGLPREEVLSLAFGFGQQLAMAEMVKALSDQIGEARADAFGETISLDGNDHVHPNTEDEHGGEG